MAEARIGTVTLLFTDLERSTEILERLGDDEAQELWRTHFRLLRNALETRGGQEVKNLGDGLMVVFTSALDAIACAVAMQQAVYRHNQQEQEARRLQVRVGLDVGEPIRDEQDYFGMPVVVAQRLCGRARGGQILVSDLVRRLVGSRGGYTFRNPEPLSLKGIAEPLTACELVWQERAEEPVAPLPLPPHLAPGKRTTFVGRGRELKRLRRVWENARTGRRQLVLLTGEPGIGKTRLAAEFAIAAHTEGATVLFGRSDEAALPYQAFAEALRHYLATCPPSKLRAELRATGGDLTALVPELAQRLPDLPTPSPLDQDGERRRLYDAIAGLLAEASQTSPIVLILDDLHWADEPSLLLLKHIVRSQEQSSLLILGTYRETELARTHPLSKVLADLRRDRAFERVSLKGLERGDVGALIDTWAGEKAPQTFIQAVYAQTEGNPFFIEEVLRHLAETSAVSGQKGRPTTDLTTAQQGVPESVKEVIGQRLSRLSEECNSVLTVASVIGREFGLDALERASDLSGNRLLDLLEEAVAARVVEEVPHMVGRYSFSHALIHETLYDELTTTRRVRLHGQTLQYADSHGVKLAYEMLGASGPFLVAVGLGSCPAVRTRDWTIARHWDRVGHCCRLILYDRRGVGFSAAPERGYSPHASMDDLRAVLDAVGVERAILWAATDGGPLALAFAAQHPDRVSGLVLLGSSAKYTSTEDFALGVNPAFMESFLRADAVDRGRAVSQLTQTRRARSGAEAIGEVMKRVPRQVWPKVAGGVGAADARTLLAEVRAPTLIIHDPDNSYIPVEAAHYLHEHIPNSKLEITKEYRTPPFEETLYRKIDAFIEEVAVRSTP